MGNSAQDYWEEKRINEQLQKRAMKEKKERLLEEIPQLEERIRKIKAEIKRIDKEYL